MVRARTLGFSPAPGAEWGGGGGELGARTPGFLTTLEPFLVQARVRGGFPLQAQVKVASAPMSTVRGVGGARRRGPTVGGGGAQCQDPPSTSLLLYPLVLPRTSPHSPF